MRIRVEAHYQRKRGGKMTYFFTEKSLEEEIYEYCMKNGIPLIYGGLLLSYRH